MTQTAEPADLDDTRPTVAIVGGGLAGLTAALMLARRNFKVTLYEATESLGGNLSSEKVDGVWHDVYPHMFCPWYSNFWKLFEEELGGVRSATFEARDGVKLLDKEGRYIELKNATSFESVIANLRSGLASWPDMFLLGFSMLDLAATPFDRRRDDQLENLDVNGFIYSRGYATQSVAQLQNYILMVIWSIQSEVTAASCYQDFIRHTIDYPSKTPFCYLLTGPLQTKLIDPIERKLTELRSDQGKPACVIEKNAHVTRVELVVRGSVTGCPRLTVKRVGANLGVDEDTPPRGETVVDFDYVVVATPARETSNLILTGPAGARIVDVAPQLSQLQRLRAEAIPVLDLYFKIKIPDLPRELFALVGSKQTYADQDCLVNDPADCDMTVLDLSQLWVDDPNMKGVTALAVAASNRYALPAMEPKEVGFLMIKHLHDYLPTFNPGLRWGDAESDVCWEKTHFRSNDGNRLFVDEVGTWYIRPLAAYPREMPFVFFAGDYCRTDVDMATIEASVQSGLLAAQGVQDRRQQSAGELRGAAITIAPHEVYSDAYFLAVKLLLLPFAYVATAISAHMEKTPATLTGELPPNVYSPKTYSLLLPVAFTLDWWKTAYWLARRVIAQAQSVGPEGVTAVSGLLSAAGRAAEAIGVERKAEADFAPGERLTRALTDFGGQAARAARAAFPQRIDSAHPGAKPHRRWRVKS